MYESNEKMFEIVREEKIFHSFAPDVWERNLFWFVFGLWFVGAHIALLRLVPRVSHEERRSFLIQESRHEKVYKNEGGSPSKRLKASETRRTHIAYREDASDKHHKRG